MAPVVTFREDALVVCLAAPRRAAVVLFAGLWAAGWCLTVAGLALHILRHPDIDFERNIAALLAWTIAGGAVGFALFWMAGGQQEVVRVDGSTIAIERHAGPFRRTTTIDVFAIRGIGYRDTPARSLFDVAPVAQFWRGGMGRIVVDTDRGVRAFGDALSDEDADATVSLLRARLAHIPVATAYRPAAPLGIAKRYATGAVTALVAALLLWPAVTIPARLLIVDRSICFYDDTASPDDPAPASGARGGRRVHLVALDGMTTEALEAVASPLRARHRTPIDISATKASVEAYDTRRRQLDAGKLLDALEVMYPARTSIVIGVTGRDMYIPAYNWRYAFSYRGRDRLAVVSTARMERGCLGLFAANEDRQRSRLRKMIGKNIGVLYYGLALSHDPRSLMYANVGGPQELDVMSEVF